MSDAALEQRYVHSVYDDIAPHFSATRYKPWPLVAEFLENLPVGYLGVDIGCGNGKYLGIKSGLTASTSSAKPHLLLGIDRSINLLKIAQERGHEVIQADCLSLPFRKGVFDFAISIATVHHLVSPIRRKAAISEILSSLKSPSSKFIIQVWAQEQESEASLARRKGPSNVVPAQLSDESTDQDVFVPWQLQSAQDKEPFKRYYHLFKEGELDDLIRQAADSLDYEQEWESEIEVLQSIFTNEEEFQHVNGTFVIRILPLEHDQFAQVELSLRIKRTPTYPDELPGIELDIVQGDLTEDDLSSLKADLITEAEASIGMSMAYTLATTLQELLTQLQVAKEEAKLKEQLEKARIADEAEAARTRGTPVTLESFTEWKAKFLAETRAKKEKDLADFVKSLSPKEREERRRLEARPTGRELFEKNKVIQFKEEEDAETTEVDFSKYTRDKEQRQDDDDDERIVVDYSDSE